MAVILPFRMIQYPMRLPPAVSIATKRSFSNPVHPMRGSIKVTQTDLMSSGLTQSAVHSHGSESLKPKNPIVGLLLLFVPVFTAPMTQSEERIKYRLVHRSVFESSPPNSS